MDDAKAVSLLDDLVTVKEILLRFPPEDPACLVRAALVCKRWCRLISSTDFRRRFRKFHGTRPMLGFLCNLVGGDDANTIGERLIVRFVPTSSHSWRPRPTGYRVLDSRHGRVLLCSLPLPNEAAQIRLFVWDPITDERVELPMLLDSYYCGWNVAVLCATSSGGGCCDSLDCHRSPFLVVFMGTMTSMSRPLARVYSSEAGTWSEVITSNITCEHVIKQPCALAGNALYFMSTLSVILKFDLATRRISRIGLPGTIDLYHGVLTTNQDGGLEFVQVVGSELHRWSREADLDDEDAGWARRRVIDLKTLLPTKPLPKSTHVLGSAADGVGVIFIETRDGVFTINPKSDQVMKLEGFGVEKESSRAVVCNILPYVNFYTPDFKRHMRL